MQQFLSFIVFSAYVMGVASAEPLTTARVSCESKASVGQIDLMAPPKAAPKVEPAKRGPSSIAFVPIETALNGSANAPTAYHGAIAVPLPQASGADYSGDCTPRHTKPVAADTLAP